MIFKPGAALYSYEIVRESGENVMYVNYMGASFVPSLIDSGELGEIKNVQFQRIGFGPVRKDVSALWDLALHDVSIALFLLGKEPDEVNAVGSSWLQEGIEDSVILNLRFEDVNVGINAGWFSPVKERKLVIVGDKKMASFDDVSKELQVFNKCMEIGCLIDKGVETEKVEDNPLKEEIEHFLECVKMRKAPLSGAGVGERVVRILEEAEGKLKGE